MTNPREDLVRAISSARDKAKELLTLLETQGHPQTSKSSALYLALVSLLKRLTKENLALPVLAIELAQLTTLCEGKLAPIKPQLEDALRMARGPATR